MTLFCTEHFELRKPKPILRGFPAYASIERHRHDTKSVLESFGGEVRERYADCSTEFRTGIPCEEIIQAAKDLQIDMLVISTHGHKWFRRVAYGSNAEELGRRAPCPVLLVHEDDAASVALGVQRSAFAGAM